MPETISVVADVSKIANVLTRLQVAQDQGIIQKRDLRQYDPAIGHIQERMNRVNQSDDEVKALNRLFKEQIKQLRDPSEEGVEGATSIFDGLFDHVFDAGTNRKVGCEFEAINKEGRAEKVRYESKEVPIHSRASLINNVLEHVNNDKKAVDIGLIDLKDLRSADFILEGQRDNPGDVLINKSAAALRRALHMAWIDPDLGLKDNKNATYEVGRYGGDEFMFALIGDVSQNQKNRIIEIIEEQLKLETGYYRRKVGKDFVIEADSIRLKADEEKGNVKWIEVPKDSTDKTLFLEYFERGLLLDVDELTKIKRKYTPDGTNFDMAAYRKDYPTSRSLYPSKIKSFEDKITFIQNQHPELAIYFDLARVFDVEAGEGSKRQELVLKMVERSVFDPLIGEAIYTRFDFQEHLMRGEFSNVMIVDLKFMKEMNENMSYADADNAIIDVWKKIKLFIPPSDRGKIFVSRFGGTFVMGIRKGEYLSVTAQKALESLDQDKLRLYSDRAGSPVDVPLGVTQWRTSDNTNLRQMQKVNDLKFYSNMLKDMSEIEMKSPGFMEQFKTIPIDRDPHAPYQEMPKVELYAKFFRGKRRVERLADICSLYNNSFLNVIQPFATGVSKTDSLGRWEEAKGRVMRTLEEMNKN